MEGKRFDTLTRRLSTGTTRRAALRGLLAAAGGLLGLGAVDDALSATCREPGRLCTKHANCCSGLCDTTNPDPTKRYRCLDSGQGTCATGADFCRDGIDSPASVCNGSLCCHCFTKLNGSTACMGSGGVCIACASDGECAAVLGPGSVCVTAPANSICECADGTACVPPCTDQCEA